MRISTTQDFALTYLWPVLRSFSTRYPEVSFNIDFSSRIVDLIAEGFDGSSVIVDESLAASWMEEAARLPGWDEGHEYAPHPVLVMALEEEDEL